MISSHGIDAGGSPPGGARLAPIRIMIREVRHEVLRRPVALSPSRIKFIQSPGFTRSDAWVRLRYDFMRDHDGRCQCCGRSPADGPKVNVDHIFPRKTHPQFALAYSNLQVLCAMCNRGKGNRDRTDWRFRKPAEQGASVTPACDACGAPTVARIGRSGKFWGCSRFPECRATKRRARTETGRRTRGG